MLNSLMRLTKQNRFLEEYDEHTSNNHQSHGILWHMGMGSRFIQFTLLGWISGGCTGYLWHLKMVFAAYWKSYTTNLTGVFWAMVIISGAQFMSIDIMGYVLTVSYHS